MEKAFPDAFWTSGEVKPETTALSTGFWSTDYHFSMEQKTSNVWR